jgi:Trypsin
MRLRLTLVFALLAALCAAGSASAIFGGSLETRSFIGGALQQQTHDGVTGFQRCSGFLIGPTSFVTAAHCFDPNGAQIRVTFDQNLSPATSNFVSASIAGTFGDIAVLTLDPSHPQPAWLQPPALNASAGVSTVDVAGYGVGGYLEPGKVPTAFGTRMVATTSVKSAGSQSDEFLKLLADPGGCFGDSGGPNFVTGTNIVVAITTSGQKNCNGISYSERLDTPGAIAFLTPFVNT